MLSFTQYATVASDIQLLSTGTLPAALEGRLNTGNCAVTVIPFIRTGSSLKEQDTIRIWSLIMDIRVLVLTSIAAVTALIDNLEPVNIPDIRLYCIDGATARAAAGLFGEAAITTVAPDSAALAALIINQKEKAVLFCCGDRRLDVLPELLTAAGIRVTEQVVYRTILTPQPIKQQYDGILFFSPSAAESFFSVNNITATTRLFAIGNTTGTALKQYVADNEIIIAAIPSKEATVMSAIQYFKR